MRRHTLQFLFVTLDPFPHVGGKSTHISTLIQGLNQLGHYAEVLSPARFSILETWLVRAMGAMTLPLGKTNSFWVRTNLRQRLLRKRIRRQLEASRYDAIILEEPGAHSSIMGISPLPMLIHTVHGDWTNERISAGVCKRESFFGRYLLSEEKASYQRVDRIVTVDTRLYQHVNDLVDDPAPSEVMPNFINLALYPFRDEEMKRQARIDLGIPLNQTILLCPRRLTPKNGVQYAIGAVNRLKERNLQSIKLLIAGDGPQAEELRSMVERNHLASMVQFLGDVPNQNMPKLLAATDIVVIPSVPSEGVIEATSIAALEAMARGIPVVASAIGGLAELIVSGETGILVPPGDEGAIAQAIARLGQDQDLCNQLAGAARDRIEKHHSHLSASKRYVRIVQNAQLEHRGDFVE